MLSEEQIKKLISINDSLRVQLEDVNTVLRERENELDILKKNSIDATALRSKLDIQSDEMESVHDRLNKEQQQLKGAEEREIELQLELTEMARLQMQYNELAQQYAYQHSQFSDIQSQLTELSERNLQLQKIAGRIGELESKLESTGRERDDLKSRLTLLESEKYLRVFNP